MQIQSRRTHNTTDSRTKSPLESIGLIYEFTGATIIILRINPWARPILKSIQQEARRWRDAFSVEYALSTVTNTFQSQSVLENELLA